VFFLQFVECYYN